MSKRKAISKRTRFEIFKRDLFTCQYCGKKPPAIILHVDHIVPVCNGGGFESENLLSACSDCNLGKSGIALGVVIEPIKNKIKSEMDRLEQVAEYNALLSAIHAAREVDFNLVSNALISARGDEPCELVIAGTWASTVRMMLKKLPVVEIVWAVETANERIDFTSNTQNAWRYFCGICWRKVDELEGVVR